MVQFTGLFVFFFSVLLVRGGQSGSGRTTRYWDCCKGTCAWPGKATLSQGPVQSCSADNQPLYDGGNTAGGCGDGTAFMCSSQQPWAVNDTFAYGFAAVKLTDLGDADWCCACYELTFTSSWVNGKKMIVQVTNTGGDLGENHFDIAIPGGGLGLFDGCSKQYNSDAQQWGNQGGSVSTRDQCYEWPSALQSGCFFLFDWYSTENPSVNFQKVSCPSGLTDKTGCIRPDN